MTEKSKNTGMGNNRFLIIGGVLAVVIVVVIVAVVMISNTTSATSAADKYAAIPQSRSEDGGFVLGDAEAPVKIVAFEDFLCPVCQNYKPTVDRIVEELVATGQAQFEYRILPAVDATFSEVAGELAVCADELGSSFWVAHDILFDLASSERFNDRTPRQFAERMDISYDELLECQAEEDQANIDTAFANEVGARGTPSVYYQIGDGALVPLGQDRGYDTIAAIVQSAQ